MDISLGAECIEGKVYRRHQWVSLSSEGGGDNW